MDSRLTRERSLMMNRDSQHVPIAIAGSGFSGLGMAIRLRQKNIFDFALFERAENLGGTWRDNSYPGCACDVESHLYSFSFALNPRWSRTFSPQAEIYAYLRRCAVEHGVLPHIRFGHELLAAHWDQANSLWRLSTSRGTFTADVLVSGMGGLSEPSIPQLPGLERFAGTTFHSARWDHGHELSGRRVAVIGSGASAVQFVPEIQPKVGQLTLFQRTPAWVVPRADRAISELEKRAFEALPALQKVVRAAIYARREIAVLGFRNPGVMRLLESYARRYLRECVPDPALRQKLTPNFRIGCKRILISSEYLQSLSKPNVDVVTHPIREIKERSIVTADGVEHTVDTIIFGTGFHTTDMPFANRLHGGDGRSLMDTWKGSPEAYLGTTVAGFPNLFLLLGPNTALGHTSVVMMVESQIELVLGAILHMRANHLKTLEPRASVQAAFVREVDRKTTGTVWTSGGCSSWYLDKNGRNSTLWPGFTFSFMRRARFRPAEYTLETQQAGATHVR
jgi:cation diffusion facilitator CzcD-associated flavoprotein CzcO